MMLRLRDFFHLLEGAVIDLPLLLNFAFGQALRVRPRCVIDQSVFQQSAEDEGDANLKSKFFFLISIMYVETSLFNNINRKS
jgi:hypothetical protein